MTLSTLNQSKIDRIKQELRWHPEGMTISRLATKLKINRNILAKYLDSLLISGQVIVQVTGTAKVYFLSQRVPVAAVLEQVSDAVIVLDKDFQILQVNHALLSLLQTGRETLVGRKVDATDNPFLSGLPVRDLCNIQLPAGDQFFEMPVVLNGTTCRIRVQSLPVVFDNGSKGCVLILGDTGVLKDLQPIPEPAPLRLEGIIEDHTEFTFRFLHDGTMSSADETFCRYFQMEESKVHGISVFSLFVRDDRDQVRIRLGSLNHDHPVCTLEHRILIPRGEPRWHRWSYIVLFDPDGNRTGFLCTGKDITEKLDISGRVNQYVSDFWSLTRSSLALNTLPDTADIYKAIACGVREMVPDAIVSVNTLDPVTGLLTTRSFQGDQERDVFSRFVGRDMVGFVMDTPEGPERDHIIQNMLGAKMVRVPGDLYVTMLGIIPQTACLMIEEALNIGDIYVLGLVFRNMLLGNLAIFLRKGDTLSSNVALETFAHHAALLIWIKQLEESLNKQDSTISSGSVADDGERRPSVYEDRAEVSSSVSRQ